MSETVEPIPVRIVIPPKPPRTVGQKLAIMTMINGGVIFVFTFLPAFTLIGTYRQIMWVQVIETTIGPAFIFTAALIVAFGIGRYLTGHITFRILAIIAGLLTIALAALDAATLWNQADTKLAGTGLTFTFSPVLAMIGFFGAIVILSNCFNRQLLNKPT